jgi:release factor glutamine methyltransferase
MTFPHYNYQQAVLLASILGVDIQNVFTGQYTLTNHQIQDFEKKSSLLQNNYPLDYLIGKVPIAGMDFILTEDVLIPRPETEQLIIELQTKFSDSIYQNMTLIDLGCGSGIIGLTLAKYFNMTVCVDVSLSALQIAEKNAVINQTRNVSFKHSDILEFWIQNIDLYDDNNVILIANLPYLPDSDKLKAKEYKVEFEPALALYSGEDGLGLFRELITQLRILQLNNNLPEECLFELDPRNIVIAQSLLQHLYNDIHVQKDFNDLPRFLKAKYPIIDSRN